jgi:hypothetical protein
MNIFVNQGVYWPVRRTGKSLFLSVEICFRNQSLSGAIFPNIFLMEDIG